jgi:hypothetical protein
MKIAFNKLKDALPKYNLTTGKTQNIFTEIRKK